MRNMTKRRRLLMASSLSDSRLPHGYKEVQWLQGTGVQYCNTGVNPVYNSNNFTSIKGDITVLDKVNSNFIIGVSFYQTIGGVNSEAQYSGRYAYVHKLPADVYNSIFAFTYGKKNAYYQDVNLTNYVYPLDIHYEINRNNVKLNDYTGNWTEEYSYSSFYPILVGALRNSGGGSTPTISNILTRVKTFYIYNNNTLLYEFVPCYRTSDGKTGFMKITVADGSSEFCPNLSEETEWIIGPIV